MAILAGVACTWRVGTRINPTEPAERIFSYAQIKPDATPPRRATLNLAGVPIPVDLATQRHGDNFTVTLTHNGEKQDEERYLVSASAFSLVEGASETFDPPLDLLRFPVVIGRGHDWKGALKLGDDAIEATARVNPTLTSALVGGNPTEVVQVKVTLKLPPHGDEPGPEHTLTFMFVPGEGLQMREFGAGATSKREPIIQ